MHKRDVFVILEAVTERTARHQGYSDGLDYSESMPSKRRRDSHRGRCLRGSVADLFLSQGKHRLKYLETSWIFSATELSH